MARSEFLYKVIVDGTAQSVQFPSTKQQARAKTRAYARMLAALESRSVTVRLYRISGKDRLEDLGYPFTAPHPTQQ